MPISVSPRKRNWSVGTLDGVRHDCFCLCMLHLEQPVCIVSPIPSVVVCCVDERRVSSGLSAYNRVARLVENGSLYCLSNIVARLDA